MNCDEDGTGSNNNYDEKGILCCQRYVLGHNFKNDLEQRVDVQVNFSTILRLPAFPHIHTGWMVGVRKTFLAKEVEGLLEFKCVRRAMNGRNDSWAPA